MSNFAAWIPEKGDAFTGAAPFPLLRPGHVVVRNAAVAINPIDFKVQRSGKYVKNWPIILGQDLAGTVVQVAEDVINIKLGQRFLAYCTPISSGDSQQGAFQLYTLCNAKLCCVIPEWMSLEKACSIPLSVATAAAALFGKSMLSFPLPVKSAPPSKEVLLILGGSSSVGSAATQLACSAGLRVFATASSSNHQFVRETGAISVFDYHDDLVLDNLLQLLRNQTPVRVLDCIGTEETTKVCLKIIAELGNTRVVSVNPTVGSLGTSAAVTKGKK